VFQTGEEEEAKYEASLTPFAGSVQVRGFLEDVGSAYAAADLVISRAGATTVAELTARGLPAIMVPYPWATAGHQEENARWMEARAAAMVMSERTSRSEELAARIARLWRDPDELARMARASASLGNPRAADLVAEAALSL
jgi:UDP-N-acetylglucosamine--N-acetylmuramyl-(pentapeptide) pyrophosphoryl-undecaprenol N-acetylglucosamine transferase